MTLIKRSERFGDLLISIHLQYLQHPCSCNVISCCSVILKKTETDKPG
ncbi:Uncharacterized protein dnm_037460 [Desulfonema magnum]|uniref:Uncharacterized protein n=1 Tax=Desulfonema magnum TaxID=45655 RepID=A0A975BLN8_9BACT|nr:Uncharacterized protein dnm_037460 [Desulfonema magnum]